MKKLITDILLALLGFAVIACFTFVAFYFVVAGALIWLAFAAVDAAARLLARWLDDRAHTDFCDEQAEAHYAAEEARRNA